MLLFALGMAGSWSGLGRSAILECSAFLLPFYSIIQRYSLKTPFCPLNFFAVICNRKKGENIHKEIVSKKAKRFFIVKFKEQ